MNPSSSEDIAKKRVAKAARPSQPQRLLLPEETRHSLAKGSLRSRFWNQVKKAGPDECWIWQGRPTEKGYGRIKCNKEKIFAHRLSFVLHGGTLEDGQCVLHSCDTPLCVNPKHLRSGTRVHNRADCVERHRQARGETQGSAKATEAIVADIRASYVFRKVTGKMLAERHGLGVSTVFNILYNNNWKICT